MGRMGWLTAMPCPGGIPGAFTQLWLVRSMPGLEEDGMERRQMLPSYSCSSFRSQHPTGEVPGVGVVSRR